MTGLASLVLVLACTTPTAVQGDLAAPTTSTARVSAVLAAPVQADSTIDPRIQTIAEEELDRVVAEWQPIAGAIVVLDPSTGEILANAGRAHGVSPTSGLEVFTSPAPR